MPPSRPAKPSAMPPAPPPIAPAPSCIALSGSGESRGSPACCANRGAGARQIRHESRQNRRGEGIVAPCGIGFVVGVCEESMSAILQPCHIHRTGGCPCPDHSESLLFSSTVHGRCPRPPRRCIGGTFCAPLTSLSDPRQRCKLDGITIHSDMVARQYNSSNTQDRANTHAGLARARECVKGSRVVPSAYLDAHFGHQSAP